MHAVSLSDARANLSALMDRAAADRTAIAIKRRRGEAVVLVPEFDWAEITARLFAPAVPIGER